LTLLALLNLVGKDGCSQAYKLREKRVERSFWGFIQVTTRRATLGHW